MDTLDIFLCPGTKRGKRGAWSAYGPAVSAPGRGGARPACRRVPLAGCDDRKRRVPACHRCRLGPMTANQNNREAMEAPTGQGEPTAMLERLRRATNDHDLEAVVACFTTATRPRPIPSGASSAKT